jgi:hypothetical protein
MTRRKLERLQREHSALRRSPQRARALISLAQRLGRVRVNRGSEPTWESGEFDSLYPISIPMHGGRDLAPRTQKSILDALEDDLLKWEERVERLEEEEKARRQSNGAKGAHDEHGNGKSDDPN